MCDQFYNIDWQDGVYVLIGRKTFSAAMSNAVQYEQIFNAKLVGEPTGGNPVGFQELGTFHLPNADRAVFYSKRHYRFQEAEMRSLLKVMLPLEMQKALRT